MTNSIESHFQLGRVHLRTTNADYLLCGIFFPALFNNNGPLFDYSDRGVDHLLQLLCARKNILDEKLLTEAINEINSNYPYSRTIQTVTPFERLLQNNACEIYFKGNYIKITLQSFTLPKLITTSSTRGIPGHYERIGTGETITQAVEKLLTAEWFPISEK